jgi:hypothetical protein
MQLFMAVPMTPLVAVSDFGGWRHHRFVPICRKNRPLSSIQFIIGEKFNGGVVDTDEQFVAAVSLTPANILLAVSLTPEITFFPGVVDTGQK